MANYFYRTMTKRRADDHSRERDAMAQPLSGEKGEAIRRVVEANRMVYDYAGPLPDLVERRVTELEAALIQTRHKLRAIEDSTTWRLTRPFRQLIEAAKNLRRPLVKYPTQAENTGSQYSLAYQDWIDAEEPMVLRRLLISGTRHLPVVTPHLGLVLWTDETLGSVVAQKLVAELLNVPDEYEILLICSKELLSTMIEIKHAARPNLSIEAGEAFPDVFSFALHRMKSTYFCFQHLSDSIAPHALEIVAAALASQPQTDLLFGDEDWMDAGGQRSRPFFKPGWDPELQRGQDLVGPFAFYRAANLRSLAGFEPSGPAWRYDLAGRIVAACRPERIRHVPAVLCHRRAPLPEGAGEAMRRHAKTHLLSRGVLADIEPVDGPEPWHRIVYALPRPAPLVSIIIPTRDQVELLKDCTDGVLGQTAYPEIELVILDNGTVENGALELLDSLSKDKRVKILRRPGPFNWSALNNAGAAAGDGDVFVLLNNDISVLRPGWLNALVASAVQPDVGAVGAKLLYRDGRVQHAGITTDIRGVPRHLFRYSQPDDAGPSGMLALARSVWAVTGACLAIRRDVFFGAGGLNEGLPVAYNDIDLCMRLTAQGYRIVWTPDAVLEHRESASRPPDNVGVRREQVSEELNRLTRDWGNLVLSDPFLNPNYGLVQERLAFRTGNISGTASEGIGRGSPLLLN